MVCREIGMEEAGWIRVGLREPRCASLGGCAMHVMAYAIQGWRGRDLVLESPSGTD